MMGVVEDAAKTALPPGAVMKIRPAYQAICSVRGRAVDLAKGSHVDVNVEGETVGIRYPNGLRSYFRNQLGESTVENCLPIAGCVAPEETDAIFDVGAYVGLYTALFSQLNPGVPTYAYEPHAPSRRDCHRTVAANDACAAVYDLAVAGEAGTTEFHVSVQGPQGHSIHSNGDAAETVAVGSTTISREIRRHGSERPFVKVDIEGGENVVLRDLLSNHDGPVAGLVELHPEKLPTSVDSVLSYLSVECDDVTSYGDTSPNHPAADRIGPGHNRPIYAFERR